jgi:hypothetical protein
MSYSNQVFKNTETGQLFDIFTQPQTDVIPSQDLTYDLGSSSRRWDRLNTNDIVFVNGGTSLNYYKETSLTMGFSGACSFSCPINFTRIGDIVQISLGVIPSTNIISALVLTSSTFLPVDLRPTVQCSFIGAVQLSGNNVPIKIQILTTGSIVISVNVITGSSQSFDVFPPTGAISTNERINGSYRID